MPTETLPRWPSSWFKKKGEPRRKCGKCSGRGWYWDIFARKKECTVCKGKGF
jgi:DnaJ-class molecular chaperone